jgi:hypothetical protein
MGNPSVVIDIAAEYTGKKAFDKAGKSTSSLEKNVKSLAKAFAGVFAAQKIMAFGKASVKAFAEDEKAAAALTQTLKNLGLGFANTGIEDFITKMSLSTGVADDQLRPAMQKLLQTNLDVAQSQKLMGLALDISAAGFGDVTSVAGDLSQAMVGNVKGIKKYNLGITQAEISNMSFAELVDKLTKTFKGQAAAAADTYAGKINIIKNAAGEAQESIGKGLIDALMAIGNNKDMQGLVDDILAAGQGIGYLIGGVGDLVKVIGSIPGFGFEGVGKNAPMPFTLNPLAILAQKYYKDQLSAQYKLEEKRLKNAIKMKWLLGAAVNPTKDTILTREEVMAGMTPSSKRKKIKEEKAAADAAKKRADELAALQKSIAKNTSDSAKAAAAKAKLDKAAGLFNLTNIGIQAALKGKISEEEKTRLLLMQAIADEDADKAEKLSKKLEEIQAKNAKIAADILAIGEASDPFAAWVTSLDAAAVILGKMPALLDATGSLTPRGKKTIAPEPGDSGGSIFTPDMTPTEIADTAMAAADMAAAAAAAATAALIVQEATVTAIVDAANAATNIADFVTNVPGATDTGSSSMYSPNPYSAVGGPGYGSMNPTINVYVEPQGSVIMPDEFVTAVNDAVLESIRVGYGRTPAGLIG